MSSINRGLKNTEQGNAYFVNMTDVSDWMIRDETGLSLRGTPKWPNFPGNKTLWNAGELVLRDQGKTIRVPAQAADSHNHYQRILRKVQLVDLNGSTPTPISTFANFNEGVGGTTTNDGVTGFITFYIELSGTAGNGSRPSDSAARWARLAM